MTPEQEALVKLAERAEAASGPDRGLDAEIAPLQGLTVVDEGHPIGRMCYDDIGIAHLMPRYTASLDAAMSLVPEGCRIVALTEGLHTPGTSAEWLCKLGNAERPGGLPAVAAHSPALALCAAALRARALIGEGEGE